MTDIDALSLFSIWAIFGAYLIFLAIAGYYAKRKTKNLSDFMVAGRSIGPILLGISFGVTYFSAVMVVGGGRYSWNWGLATLWIAGLNTLVGVVMTFVFFGKRTRALGKHFDSLTVPQLLGKRYQEKNLQTITAIVQLIFQTIYVISIYMGLATLLAVVIPATYEITFIIATVIVGIITIIYLNFGGSHGAILTDAVEAIIVLVGIVVIFIAGMIAIGGFPGLISGLQAIEADPTYGLDSGGLTTFPGNSGLAVIGMVAVTSFGVWGLPQMITRFYTAKEKKTLRWGLVISATWAFAVAFFAWFNGSISRVLFQIESPGLFPASDRTSIPYLMLATLPPVFAGVVMAAITAASLTTGEKIILMAASSYSIDVYQERTGASDDKTLKITRIVSTLVVIFGVIGSIFVLIYGLGAILDICMFAWAAMGSVILVPYILGLFWRKATGKAAVYSGLIALTISILHYFLFYQGGHAFWFGNYPDALGNIASIEWMRLELFGVASPIAFTLEAAHPFILCIPVSLVLFVIFSWRDKDGAPPKEFLNEIFSVMKEEEALPETELNIPSGKDSPEVSRDRLY
ncbi:MAG: putative SSS sodium solute transporter superfamily [Promethearchaeota archaeon]|nr:MAG: putative SSS sodium solute transporter superfamily [Candidatus Lokiarchaeota archaeon]